jgi:hypothetical protein
MDKNQTNDPRKRQGKDSKSSIIERIRSEIEAKTKTSIESLKQLHKEDYLYTKCLIYTTATNNALCATLGIPAPNGQRYCETLKANRLLYKIEFVYCPFTGCEAWTLSTNPRKALPNAGTNEQNHKSSPL